MIVIVVWILTLDRCLPTGRLFSESAVNLLQYGCQAVALRAGNLASDFARVRDTLPEWHLKGPLATASMTLAVPRSQSAAVVWQKQAMPSRQSVACAAPQTAPQ